MLMGSILSSTIHYVYKGAEKEVPFTTSATNNWTESMTPDEYQEYMTHRKQHVRKWSRMYSDSFLESEYRYDGDLK